MEKIRVRNKLSESATLKQKCVKTSVAAPDPPVFEPPGSGSTSHRYALDPDPSIIVQK